MLSTIHTKNKPSAVATLRKESVDKPSAFGYLIMEIKYLYNHYGVTNDGTIYSTYNGRHGFFEKHCARKISATISKNGYAVYNNKEIGKQLYVHIDVATAFIQNPLNKPCVNHINGIRSDNRVENLEWVTHKENSIHAVKIGNIKCKPVMQYSKHMVLISEYSSATVAAVCNGWSRQNISAACAGYRKTYKKFIWKFKQ